MNTSACYIIWQIDHLTTGYDVHFSISDTKICLFNINMTKLLPLFCWLPFVSLWIFCWWKIVVSYECVWNKVWSVFWKKNFKFEIYFRLLFRCCANSQYSIWTFHIVYICWFLLQFFFEEYIIDDFRSSILQMIWYVIFSQKKKKKK